MKKISAAALMASAHSKGASIELEDMTVNSDRSRSAAVLPLRRHAAPIEQATTRVEMDTRELVQVAQAGERRADALASVVQALIVEVRAQRDSSPTHIKGWEFKVVRDDKDRVETIRAKAIR